MKLLAIGIILLIISAFLIFFSNSMYPQSYVYKEWAKHYGENGNDEKYAKNFTKADDMRGILQTIAIIIGVIGGLCMFTFFSIEIGKKTIT